MIYGVQIIGLLFGLLMIYLTFLYYKRKDYDTRAFIIWITVWIFFLAISSFPSSVYGLMQILEVQRTADFFVMAGFLFFALMIFYLFVTIKNMQREVEEIVRIIALKRAK